jgi:hypothetical protein
VGVNCCGNGWEGNMFVCCCCWVGNFGVIPVDDGCIWGVDENGALPNIELFKPDADVRWPIERIESFILIIDYLHTPVSCISENRRLVILYCILWTE